MSRRKSKSVAAPVVATEALAQVNGETSESVTPPVIDILAQALPVAPAADVSTDVAPDPSEPAAPSPYDATQGLASVRSALAHRGAMNAQQYAFFAKEALLWNAPTIAALHGHGVDVSALATLMRNPTSGASDNGFLAKYAVDKVRKIAAAVAQANFNVMDIYTQGILYNMRKLGKITAPSCLVALSRSCSYKDNDIVQDVKAYTSKTAGTASTQRSSSREAMRALGVATVTKNARDDTITLRDTPMAHAVAALTDSALAA